jgi:hypothetical protein
MNTAPEPLSDDIAVLRAMLVAAWAERDAARAEKEQISAQNDRLRHLLRQLQRMQFGRRSEKLDPDCQCRLNFPHLCRSKIPQFFDQPAG